MPQEIPTRTPSERVRRFAKSLYNLKTDRVQASDFLGEANEVLIEAEKLGIAESFGGLLNDLAEAVQTNNPEVVLRKFGEPVHYQLEYASSAKSYLKDLAARLRGSRTGLGKLTPGTFFSFAVNMWGDDGPYCVLSVSEDAVEAVRVESTYGADAPTLRQLVTKRYYVRFYIDRPPVGPAIEVGTRLGIRFNSQSGMIEMPSDNPGPWPDSPDVVPWTDVEVRDDRSQTPLHRAAFDSPVGVVNGLLAAGSDVMARDEKSETPLHRAAFIADPAVISILLEAGAEVNAADAKGDTPLHNAVSFGKLGGIEALLEEGADVVAKGFGGQTPLHGAASHTRSPAVVAMLLDAGARLEVRDEFCSTPLHVAASGGHPKIVRELLTRGANVVARGQGGRTPLHEAASRSRKIEVIETLLDANAPLEARNDLGGTPLHDAASEGRPATISALLEAGADPLATDELGRTPWGIAQDRAKSDSEFGTSVAYRMMKSLATERERNWG